MKSTWLVVATNYKTKNENINTVELFFDDIAEANLACQELKKTDFKVSKPFQIDTYTGANSYKDAVKSVKEALK